LDGIFYHGWVVEDGIEESRTVYYAFFEMISELQEAKICDFPFRFPI